LRRPKLSTRKFRAWKKKGRVYFYEENTRFILDKIQKGLLITEVSQIAKTEVPHIVNNRGSQDIMNN
jgi:hypothetical protein